MNNFIKTAFVALSLATAGLGVSAPAASAAGIGISIDNGGAQVLLVRDHNRHGRHNGWNRHHRPRHGFCAPPPCSD